MRNEKCLFAFLSIVLYLIARLSHKNLCSDFPAKVFVFVFFLFPRLSAHNNLETTAAIGYNKHDKAKKPLRTAMRALRFHRRINGKQTKRQPDRHQVRNAGQTEEPL